MSNPLLDNRTPLVDAYCHIGLPRFSAANDAWATLGLAGIDRAVFVLGPMVPDYAELFLALEQHGNRVRAVGIPFGRTHAQIVEVTELQLRGGVTGLRVQEPDLLTSEAFLRVIGARGRWLYAINVFRTPEVTRSLLDWLERYPDARIAAPHFLHAGALLRGDVGDSLRRNLVSHPHFHPIFSRQGGVGSQRPYPHEDLRPWVEQVIELAGWERILWGSEYPVLYWRNETLAGCRDWLPALGVGADEARLAGFLGGNAARALFADPPPAAEPVTFPAWVDAQFDRQRTVPLFQPAGLDVPMALYATLHHRFVAELQARPGLTFAAYCMEKLGDM